MYELRKNFVNKKWLYMLTLLFVLASGAMFWKSLLTPAGSWIVFSFFALLYNYKVNKLKIRESFSFVLFIIIWCFISYMINGRLEDNSMFGYIVGLIGTYLFISAVPFEEFRTALTKVVFIITLIGIPIFLLNEAGLLSSFTYRGQYKYFGPYSIGWPYDFHRYAGIWHEPGAAQIITNSVLWLHFDKFTHWSFSKGEIMQIAIIILGSVLTFSTGSFMCLMLLLVSVVLNLKIKSRYKFLIYPILFTMATTIVVVMYGSEVVQNKLFGDDDHISKVQRAADIFAFWQMAQDKPIFGYGVGTISFWKVSTNLGNTANSSGVMTFLAELGFPWLIMFIVSIWKGISRFISGKSRFFLLSAIILMQFNENFIEYPITNMFIFTFLSYTGVYARKYKNHGCDGDIQLRQDDRKEPSLNN